MNPSTKALIRLTLRLMEAEFRISAVSAYVPRSLLPERTISTSTLRGPVTWLDKRRRRVRHRRAVPCRSCLMSNQARRYQGPN